MISNCSIRTHVHRLPTVYLPVQMSIAYAMSCLICVPYRIPGAIAIGTAIGSTFRVLLAEPATPSRYSSPRRAYLPGQSQLAAFSSWRLLQYGRHTHARCRVFPTHTPFSSGARGGDCRKTRNYSLFQQVRENERGRQNRTCCLPKIQQGKLEKLRTPFIAAITTIAFSYRCLV